tara:strand:- start:672 stop:1256 length:585 start_codon:yes stop_codon:yes gene_type:complete
MVLDSLLAGVMLFGSYAIRTPNEEPNPDDYEVSIGLTHKFFHINRQWEQELGTKYIDDLLWFKIDTIGVYFKPEYMNKESKSIKYVKIDWRRSWKYVTWGFTTRSISDELDLYETFASVGVSKKKTYWDKVDVEISFDGYLPSGEDGIKKLEFEDKFNINYKISEKLSIYNMGEIYRLKGKKFYKAKIGIEYNL